ncbi:hypothetical protein LGK95_12520 [Clostridium algoriphilum]|uniref:hypothetical protein n=1 Tax=Clostridium algoriphilum TaxID=198347 RepID=UPI001CF2630B|nr:hypothetical protein [Clostridium algoriphilum]MCB2294334.1 hypothetical protein [Clostridium algoriphilum]
MKKKSKLIIIIVSVLLLTIGIAIPITTGIKKTQQIKKEQAIKVAETKRLQDKAKVDKIIEDKRIADKVISDKIIAEKVEAQRVADKKIADENARIAKIASDKIVDEKLRLAKIESTRIANEKTQSVSATTNSSSVTILNYTIDGKYISACNYPNGATLQFKIGQTLRIKGNLINGATERVMMSMMDSIAKDAYNSDSKDILMTSVGGGDITIVPEKYDWDSSYKFYIVVSN